MAAINITPLTDVLLVLLVIFLVTANTLAKHGFELRSGGKSSTSPPPSKPHVLAIDAGGALSIDGRSLDQPQAVAALSALSGSLVLAAHKETRYGRVIEVLDTARQCGHRDVSVASVE
jgi:biopolymer transport protein ExbD